MENQHPGPKRLTLIWAILFVLTVSSMISARVDQAVIEPLSPLIIAVIFGLSLFKAFAILSDFLNLRASTPGWRIGFKVALGLISGLLFALSVVN
ncbi:cytochrome C oxidase subunit IV family protein [Terasakiella sp. A23]|uniref:cytochrome C oxidase subunit IV family protein n=1 Tax=Terasakiella sp. FCG-A23 TaxID=3080561 RepID=UPI00295474D9|nr:cytochrome C oxidase subunit IV family protein [Terasakiella sp. A23]MDV7339155.1 cytochrome C oxidase subunit IV family protein [Terasakiella sp. A23]